MANEKANARLPPIMHAYLDDLSKVGLYGRSKSDVVRRLIEQGIRAAIADQVIARRSSDDFPSDEDERSE